MRRIRLTVVISAAILSGCAANNVWVKQGASTNEFEADKYTCLQQAQQHAGAAVVNQYGGAAKTGAVTNWNLFDSCMQGRGWRLQDRERANRAIAQQNEEFKQKQSEFVAAMKSFEDRFKAICAKPEYAPFFLKTPCHPKDVTFEQIADNSKITPLQKPIFLKYRTEVDVVYREQLEYTHSHIGGDLDRQWVDYLDSVRPETEKNHLDLYKGEITWGEYNQHRKEFTLRDQAKWRSIFQPANK